jgi:hypothetical protein
MTDLYGAIQALRFEAKAKRQKAVTSHPSIRYKFKKLEVQITE